RQTTCLRVPALSLAKRVLTCHLTVSSWMFIVRPISLFDRLRASSSSTSRSLGASAVERAISSASRGTDASGGVLRGSVNAGGSRGRTRQDAPDSLAEG